MSGRLGEHRPFPPAVRARLYRRFVESLEARYPGYRFAVVEADDDQPSVVVTAPTASAVIATSDQKSTTEH